MNHTKQIEYTRDRYKHLKNFAYHVPMPDPYYRMTPEEIVALCKMKEMKMWPTPEWDDMHPHRWYHLKAWWVIRGATDPNDAACAQTDGETRDLRLDDPEWAAECLARGWDYWHPTTYRELEDRFLPKPIPNSSHIMARCLQMAMLHALRGDVREPYWWAGLSVTEHAEPNLSRECSDGYAGFADWELTYRQDRIRRDGIKPALCSRLDDVNPGICQHCRFNGVVRSPIALGFDREPKVGRNA